MSISPEKSSNRAPASVDNYKTPRKSRHKTVENTSSSDEDEHENQLRKSSRQKMCSKRYSNADFLSDVFPKKKTPNKTLNSDKDSFASDENVECAPKTTEEAHLFEENLDVEGKQLYGFNTPKKRSGMALAAAATPKTPKTPRTPKTPKLHGKTPSHKENNLALVQKTPRHLRRKVKNQIAKLVGDYSDSDFSADEDSDFEPSHSSSESSLSKDDDEEEHSQDDDDNDDRKPQRARRPIIVPVLPKTPSTTRNRRVRKHNTEYVPESDGYFNSHANSKIHTSDHTLDRLKNPRLAADKLFSLLASMTLSTEHEEAISSVMEEYKTYFPKWMYILNEGFNILLYGLGSKRNLLHRFHQDVLSKQPVLVVNGFFPSLTIKDILDSITNDILDIGISSANPHEAVDTIEIEFQLIPETHLYLIVHNLDGTMLRSVKAQEIVSRLAKIPNIHLLASIDHINTPLLWDHTKLSNYNFSWWDVTTMLPYTDETAFENSLLVQNSGGLALSSMRSVFSSLTTNARGIYMLIVKYQLQNKGNPNYQGMSFKDLYWSCREAFLVSSDLALRAQLTEFLDHKLVKSKRSIDGSEQLLIPIESGLLQQFLDEQQK